MSDSGDLSGSFSQILQVHTNTHIHTHTHTHTHTPTHTHTHTHTSSCTYYMYVHVNKSILRYYSLTFTQSSHILTEFMHFELTRSDKLTEKTSHVFNFTFHEFPLRHENTPVVQFALLHLPHIDKIVTHSFI